MAAIPIETWERMHVSAVVTGTVDMLISADWNAREEWRGDMQTIQEAISNAHVCSDCLGDGETDDPADEDGDCDRITCQECSGEGRKEATISHVLVSSRLAHWLNKAGASIYSAELLGIQGDASVWVRTDANQSWHADSMFQDAYVLYANNSRAVFGAEA